MGNSVLWFTPFGSMRQVKIDLGRRLHDRTGPVYLYRQAVQESVGGAAAITLFGGRSRLTIKMTWIRDGSTGDTLRRNLQALVSHLQRGGNCTLAEDITYAYCAFFATPPPVDTQATVGVESNIFEQLSPGVSIANREVSIQSDHDRYLVEPKLCSVHANNLLTFSTPIRTDMSAERWVCVREWGSWPALRMPIDYRESGDFISHDHEQRYILELPLEEDPFGMDLLASSSTPLTGDTDWPGTILDPTELGGGIGPGGGPSRGWW